MGATRRIWRVAVVADTHDRYPADLPERLRAADEIWHLGDVCDPGTLRAFIGLGPLVRVVHGNCDCCLGWPATLEVEREGLRFHLVHIPPARAPRGVQAVLHGHTHVPRDEIIGGVRWLNPGCVSRPNRGAGPSFAWLTVKAGRIAGWELIAL